MTPATVSFGDLANITATADCLANRVPIETCDPYGRSFQPYVEIPAQLLNAANLGTDSTEVIGIALAIIFLLTITLVSITLAFAWKKSTITLIASQALIALIAISPASMLAIERGQIEQLTLAFVVLALITLSISPTSRFAAFRYFGSIASFIATTTKYLSIGMFLPIIHRNMFVKKNLPMLIGLALSVAFVLVSMPSVLQATETSDAHDPKTTKSAFGVTTLLATIFSGENFFYIATNRVIENWQLITIASYALFFAATIIWVAILINARTRNQTTNNYLADQREQLSWILTLGSGGVLLFPYLLGNNNDYRLIFLIPLAAGAVLLSEQRPVIGTLLAMCAVITALTSAPMIPTPSGFTWPREVLILGDISLMILLSGIVTLWLTTAFLTRKEETV
jgi:hypothetical protein